MEWTNILIVPVLALSMMACGGEQEPGPQQATPTAERGEAATSETAAPYAFDAPEASLPLADDLKEISGITVLPDGRLAAVQDEDGILYLLNPETGDIEERLRFGGTDDYEGIEAAGDRLFVLKSNGTLIELVGWEQGEPQVREYKTHLKGKNDTEGIGYDAAHNRLLVVTKEDPGADMDKDFKAIYGFDLSTNTLAEEPVYVIDRRTFEDQLSSGGKFKPSGLAVDPSSGQVYLLSSTAKAVVALNAGEVVGVWNLPEDVYEQPEGIVFLPGGDLLISSEGVNRPGMIHRIAPQGGP